MTLDKMVVSLDHEAQVLRLVIDAARYLVTWQGEEVEPEFRGGLAAAAMLSLVDCRLRALEKTFRGESDPREVLAQHNGMPAADDGGQVELRPWTTEQQLSLLRQEVERLELVEQRLRRERGVSAKEDADDFDVE